jgi:hypothetical protein
MQAQSTRRLPDGSSVDQKDHGEANYRAKQGVADYPANYHCFAHVFTSLMVRTDDPLKCGGARPYIWAERLQRPPSGDP